MQITYILNIEMNKFFISIGRFSGEKERIYNTYLSPRNKQFCNLHNIKYISVDNSIKLNLAEIYNHHYIRFWIIKQALDSGKIKDGDIVYHYDADIFIAKLDKCIEPKKSFTYAIDSGNTHIAGMFCMIINDFTRKLIDLYLNIENVEKAKRILVYNEHNKREEPMFAHDQYMFYHYAGIKPHSWESFWDLPHRGFHSCVTPLTEFSIEELEDNIEILPTPWNVTHLVEETGDNGKPNTYDINRCKKEDVINRHFAGGQTWNAEEWTKFVHSYDNELKHEEKYNGV